MLLLEKIDYDIKKCYKSSQKNATLIKKMLLVSKKCYSYQKNATRIKKMLPNFNQKNATKF